MTYIPDRADAIWLDFDPQAGREQAGRRPALVLSPALYNRRAGLALVCPITSRVKGYPFEVPLLTGLPISGVVLSDRVRSVDWQLRKAAFIAQLPAEVFTSVIERLEQLLKP